MKTLLSLLAVALLLLPSCALAGKRVVPLETGNRKPETGKVEERAVRVAKVFIYPDRGGEFRWSLISSNGRVIADSSEGYASRAGAIRALRTVTQTLPQAVQVNLYRK